MTRIAWGRCDEHDGLRSALKAVVDAVALALDVDDGDTERLTLKYGQEVTREKESVQTRKGSVSQSVNRVRVEIRTRAAPVG